MGGPLLGGPGGTLAALPHVCGPRHNFTSTQARPRAALLTRTKACAPPRSISRLPQLDRPPWGPACRLRPCRCAFAGPCALRSGGNKRRTSHSWVSRAHAPPPPFSNPQVADWAGEGGKSARSAAPSRRRVSGPRALARAPPSAADLDSPASPSLSVGSSLYSLYTEASSHDDAAAAAAARPQASAPGASSAALAAAYQVRAAAAAALCGAACLALPIGTPCLLGAARPGASPAQKVTIRSHTYPTAQEPTLVVSEPMQGLELGAVVGRWADGLTYHGTWNGRQVAVTVSLHRVCWLGAC